jgi:hypothetical protein
VNSDRRLAERVENISKRKKVRKAVGKTKTGSAPEGGGTGRSKTGLTYSREAIYPVVMKKVAMKE